VVRGELPTLSFACHGKKLISRGLQIRPSHASHSLLPAQSPFQPAQAKKERWDKDKMVKGRNEPVSTGLVAHVVAKLKSLPVEQVATETWRNSCSLFGLDDSPPAKEVPSGTDDWPATR
jgi:hypothetical protein